jgi:nitrogenase subunit NifH
MDMALELSDPKGFAKRRAESKKAGKLRGRGMSYFMEICGPFNDRMEIRFLGEIPLDLRIREAGDRGVPVVVADPEGAEARAFVAMAQNVAGAVSVEVIGKAPRLPVIGAQPRA